MKKSNPLLDKKNFIILSLLPPVFLLLFYIVAVPLGIGSENNIVSTILFSLMFLVFFGYPIFLIVLSVLMLKRKILFVWPLLVIVLNLLLFVIIIGGSIIGVSA